MDITVFGYGEDLFAVLQALGLLVVSSEFKALIGATVLVGLCITLFKAAFTPRASIIFEVGKFIVLALFFIHTFLGGSTVSVNVIDKKNNQLYTGASNVPKGIATLLKMTTSLDYSLTRAFATAFSTPRGVETYASTGIFAFAPRLYLAAANTDLLTDNTFKTNVQEYIDKCLLRELQIASDNLDILKDKAITKSAFEYWKPIHARNLIVEQRDSSGVSVVRCETAYENLEYIIHDIASKQFAATISGDGGKPLMRAFIKDGLPVTEKDYDNVALMFGQGWQDTREQLQSLAAFKLMDGQFVSAASSLGLSPQSSAFAIANVKMMATNQFFGSAQMAMEYMPLVKTLVILFIAVASALLCMLLIMFHNMIFWKTLLTLNIWVVIWSPLICILDYFIMLRAEHLADMLNDGTLAGMSALFNNYQGEILFAGNMLWTIPVLAFAIASGSAQGFVQFASSLGQHFASSAMMGARQVTQLANSDRAKIAVGPRMYDIANNVVTRTSVDRGDDGSAITRSTSFDMDGKSIGGQFIKNGSVEMSSINGDRIDVLKYNNPAINTLVSHKAAAVSSIGTQIMAQAAMQGSHGQTGGISKNAAFSKQEQEALQGIVTGAKNIAASMGERLGQDVTIQSVSESGKQFSVQVGTGDAFKIIAVNGSYYTSSKDSTAQKFVDELNKSVSEGGSLATSTTSMLSHAKSFANSFTAQHADQFAHSEAGTKSELAQAAETYLKETSVVNSLGSDGLKVLLNQKYMQKGQAGMEAAFKFANRVQNLLADGKINEAHELVKQAQIQTPDLNQGKLEANMQKISDKAGEIIDQGKAGSGESAYKGNEGRAKGEYHKTPKYASPEAALAATEKRLDELRAQAKSAVNSSTFHCPDARWNADKAVAESMQQNGDPNAQRLVDFITLKAFVGPNGAQRDLMSIQNRLHTNHFGELIEELAKKENEHLLPNSSFKLRAYELLNAGYAAKHNGQMLPVEELNKLAENGFKNGDMAKLVGWKSAGLAKTLLQVSGKGDVQFQDSLKEMVGVLSPEDAAKYSTSRRAATEKFAKNSY